jgi:hypothetical protein
MIETGFPSTVMRPPRRRRAPTCHGPFSKAAAVIEAWQAWAPDAPDELAASINVTEPGGVEPAPPVNFYAAFQGIESEASDFLDQLVVRTGSDTTASYSRAMSFPETRGFFGRTRISRRGTDARTSPRLRPRRPPRQGRPKRGRFVDHPGKVAACSERVFAWIFRPLVLAQG